MVPIFKGKESVQVLGIASIRSYQFGFMSGRSTMEPIFILRKRLRYRTQTETGIAMTRDRVVPDHIRVVKYMYKVVLGCHDQGLSDLGHYQ